MGPAPMEGSTQVPTELAFQAFEYSKRIKPLLKREETFFTSLRSYYQIYYYSLLYAVYMLFSQRRGYHTKI